MVTCSMSQGGKFRLAMPGRPSMPVNLAGRDRRCAATAGFERGYPNGHSYASGRGQREPAPGGTEGRLARLLLAGAREATDFL